MILKILSVALLLISASSTNADVLPIQSFKTQKGLDVWLVEDHTSPIVSLALSFDKPKIDSPYGPLPILLRNVIADGAGILTSQEMIRFAKETPASTQLTFGLSKNFLSLTTTKKGLKETLKLWSRLLGTPHFQKANLAHSKSKTLVDLSNLNEDLPTLSFLNLLKSIFPQAHISADFQKTSQQIQSLTPQNLEQENDRQFLSSYPQIVAVGDIEKKDLIELLDATLGTLPFHTARLSSQTFEPHWKRKDVFIKKNVPQAVVSFGQPGLSPLDKDYPKFLLLQNVLAIRFYEEIREKRGLIYSINFYANFYKDANLLTGDVSSSPSNVAKVIKFIRSEWEKLKEFGITQQELSIAKLAFKRANILNLTSTAAVAAVYKDFQTSNLSPERAKGLLEETHKITLEEMNQFVYDILKPELLTFVIVGPSSPSKGKK